MTVIGRLARTGLRKGVFEGSRPWLYTGAAALAVRFVARFREHDRTVYSADLEPGEGVEIRVVPPDTR